MSVLANTKHFIITQWDTYQNYQVRVVTQEHVLLQYHMIHTAYLTHL